MKLKATYLAITALLVSQVLVAAEEEQKPGVMLSNTETTTATIQKVDKKTREITLKGSDGTMTTMVAGPEVKNFDQLKKGDQVNTEYSRALALYVRKSDEPLTHEETNAIETAKKGQKPGVTATRIGKVTAEVESVDYDTRMMTLRGPKGKTMTFRVDEEVKRLNEIKKGDQVVANYMEAVAIHVTPGKK